MNNDYGIRCTPTDIQWPSYLVGDGRGEVLHFATIEAAVAEAICYQDRTKSDVSYVVLEVRSSERERRGNRDWTDRARSEIESRMA